MDLAGRKQWKTGTLPAVGSKRKKKLGWSKFIKYLKELLQIRYNITLTH